MHESWNSFHAKILTDYLISNNIAVILQSVMNCSLVFTSSNLVSARKQERFRFGFLVFNCNQTKYWQNKLLENLNKKLYLEHQYCIDLWNTYKKHDSYYYCFSLFFCNVCQQDTMFLKMEQSFKGHMYTYILSKYRNTQKLSKFCALS